MRLTVLAALLAGAVVVWAFAIVGALTVAQAVGERDDPPPDPLIAGVEVDVDGSDIAGLGRMPQSIRSEHRVSTWGGIRTTEVEYVVPGTLQAALRHYRSAFATGSWELERFTRTRGAWVFEITSGSRQGRIEIERFDGQTEIHVEVLGPAAARGSSSGR